MKRIYFSLLAVLSTALAFAQDKGTDIKVDINKNSGTANFPWIWVIVGVVVLIILVLALSSRGGSDRVVERKTVIKE
jgi:uncharacterized membrane protein